MFEIIASRPSMTEREKVDQEVWKNAFIPRSLNEVIDIERDINKAMKGNTDGVCTIVLFRTNFLQIYYQNITGLKPDLSGAKVVPTLLEQKKMEEKKKPTKVPEPVVKEESEDSE